MTSSWVSLLLFLGFIVKSKWTWEKPFSTKRGLDFPDCINSNTEHGSVALDSLATLSTPETNGCHEVALRWYSPDCRGLWQFFCFILFVDNKRVSPLELVSDLPLQYGHWFQEDWMTIHSLKVTYNWYYKIKQLFYFVNWSCTAP